MKCGRPPAYSGRITAPPAPAGHASPDHRSPFPYLTNRFGCVMGMPRWGDVAAMCWICLACVLTLSGLRPVGLPPALGRLRRTGRGRSGRGSGVRPVGAGLSVGRRKICRVSSSSRRGCLVAVPRTIARDAACTPGAARRASGKWHCAREREEVAPGAFGAERSGRARPVLRKIVSGSRSHPSIHPPSAGTQDEMVLSASAGPTLSAGRSPVYRRMGDSRGARPGKKNRACCKQRPGSQSDGENVARGRRGDKLPSHLDFFYAGLCRPIPHLAIC